MALDETGQIRGWRQRRVRDVLNSTRYHSLSQSNPANIGRICAASKGTRTVFYCISPETDRITNGSYWSLISPKPSRNPSLLLFSVWRSRHDACITSDAHRCVHTGFESVLSFSQHSRCSKRCSQSLLPNVQIGQMNHAQAPLRAEKPTGTCSLEFKKNIWWKHWSLSIESFILQASTRSDGVCSSWTDACFGSFLSKCLQHHPKSQQLCAAEARGAWTCHSCQKERVMHMRDRSAVDTGLPQRQTCYGQLRVTNKPAVH